MTGQYSSTSARQLIQRLERSLDGRTNLKYAQKTFRRVNAEVIEDSYSAVWILGDPNCFMRALVPNLSDADALVCQTDADFNAAENWELKNQDYRARVIKKNEGWHLEHLVRGRLDNIWPQLLTYLHSCFNRQRFSDYLEKAVGETLFTKKAGLITVSGQIDVPETTVASNRVSRFDFEFDFDEQHSICVGQRFKGPQTMSVELEIAQTDRGGWRPVQLVTSGFFPPEYAGVELVTEATTSFSHFEAEHSLNEQVARLTQFELEEPSQELYRKYET